jgi:hypothetical protein
MLKGLQANRHLQHLELGGCMDGDPDGNISPQYKDEIQTILRRNGHPNVQKGSVCGPAVAQLCIGALHAGARSRSYDRGWPQFLHVRMCCAIIHAFEFEPLIFACCIWSSQISMHVAIEIDCYMDPNWRRSTQGSCAFNPVESTIRERIHIRSRLS